jgi:hypothetical protein
MHFNPTVVGVNYKTSFTGMLSVLLIIEKDKKENLEFKLWALTNEITAICHSSGERPLHYVDSSRTSILEVKLRADQAFHS